MPKKCLDKRQMYTVSGEVFGDVARRIGIPLAEAEISRIVGMHTALVDYDVVSEDGSAITAYDVVDILGVRQTPDTVSGAERLLNASLATMQTANLGLYLDMRAEEALGCVDIIKAEIVASDQEKAQWCQLGHMAVAGIMLDTASDALVDHRLGQLQFEPTQVVRGAVRRFCSSSRSMDLLTWRSLIASSNRRGLTRHMLGKPLRVFKQLRVDT